MVRCEPQAVGGEFVAFVFAGIQCRRAHLELHEKTFDAQSILRHGGRVVRKFVRHVRRHSTSPGKYSRAPQAILLNSYCRFIYAHLYSIAVSGESIRPVFADAPWPWHGGSRPPSPAWPRSTPRSPGSA